MKKDYNYHYVYRITNTVTGYHYYGSKSCNEKPTENIGIKYFSTSTNKFFIQDQKNNPQDYKYKVIKIFETCRKDATQLEIDLHKKFDVKNHPKFINKANQTSTKFDTTGRILKIHEKKKLSEKMKGRFKSKEEREKLSNIKKEWARKKGTDFFKVQRKKQLETQQIIQKNGLTKAQEISKKTIQTLKNTVDIETGLTLFELKCLKDSRAKKGKPNPKNAGSNSATAKKIRVYDTNDVLVFESNGNLKILCEQFNILQYHLRKSYNNNSKIIEYSVTKRNKYLDINGWWGEIV